MKQITRADIPAKYLFCLDMYQVTDKYLAEVNKQLSFERRKVQFAKTFSEFISYSFGWDGIKFNPYTKLLLNRESVLHIVTEFAEQFKNK